MALKRTPDEIAAEVIRSKDDDLFGFYRDDLISYLPFSHAKPYLIDGATEKSWRPKTGDPLDEIRKYLPFAWEKANNCRGLSAMRSLDHMRAWLWLAGNDDIEAQFEDYTYYGKPHLRAISEGLGVKWRRHDNGRWRNNEEDEGVPADEVARVTVTTPV